MSDAATTTRLVLVSGLSGSGKSVALHTLEDQGYYCVDNLPATLLEPLVESLLSADTPSYPLIAVGVDARNAACQLSAVPDSLRRLRERGIACEILFLKADDETLVKRFSETRRRHPLSGAGMQRTTLVDAIAEERELLGSIFQAAALVVDTSQLNIHQLRELLLDQLVGHREGLTLAFVSFGFKHGVPDDANFVFDVRCLPNPHWDPRLRPLTGRDPAVIDYLAAQPLVTTMFEQIRGLVDQWVPCFERENRSYLTLAIGCTGGQHRSVYLAERLAEHYRSRDRGSVSLRHRELT